jgi:CheY-like chemotaxis protein
MRALPPVLLVEDDADARYLFGALARRAGIQNHIDIAACGEDAIDYLKACANQEQPWPCVTFLDIKMRGVNGFDVLEWIRNHGFAGKTVIVMHSSSEDPSDIRESFRRGAHAFLPKGDVEAALAKIVSSAMRLAPPLLVDELAKITRVR